MSSSFTACPSNPTGGADGVRDSGLLESALAQPSLSFGGQYAHEGLFAMAAAYLFHIARNHPFIDGNKRAALLAALVFLDLNGITIERESEAMYELTMGVAEGVRTRPRWRSHSSERHARVELSTEFARIAEPWSGR